MEINPQNKKTVKDNIKELLQLWKVANNEFRSNDETRARQLLKEILEEIQTQSIIPQFEKGQSQIFITILSKYYDCQKWLEFDKLNKYKGFKDSSPKLQNKINELQNKTLNTSLGQNIINTNTNQNTNNGFNNISQTPKSPTNILDYQSNRRSSNPLNSTNNNNIEHNVYKNNSNIDIISNNNTNQNQVQQEIESNGKSDNDNNKNININSDEINQAMINSNSTGKQKGQDQQLEVFLSNFVNEIKKEIKEEGKQQKNDLEGKIEKFLAQIQKREEQLQKELDNLKQNQVISNINQNSNNTNNNQNSSGNTRFSHNLNLNNNLGHSISPKQNYFSAHQNHQYQYLNDDSQYALQKPGNGQDFNMTKIKLMQSQDQQDNIQELNNQRPINYIPRISNSPYSPISGSNKRLNRNNATGSNKHMLNSSRRRMDQSQQSIENQLNQQVFQRYNEKFVIKKQIWIGEQKYNFQISLKPGSLYDQYIQITAYSGDQEIQNKQIQKQNFIEILKIVFLEEVLPLNIQLNQINDFFTFCKYCIYPFITMGENDKKDKIIIVQDTSLFQEPFKQNFLGELIKIQLNYIHSNQFRLTLINSKSPQQNVMFFEMHLDYTSFFDYFDIFNAEMEQKMSDLQEFEEFDQQIDEWTKGEQKLQQYQIQQLLNKHQNRVQKQEYYVETLIIKKEEELRNFISEILKHIEVFFKNQNIGVLFNTLVEDKNHKLVKINIYDNFQKARIGFVKENWASQNFDIILKNYHYTYGLQGKLIQAEGHKKMIPFDFLNQNFGIQQEKLTNQEKKIVYNMVLNMFYLKEFVKEIGDDEVFLYQENSLYGENLEIVSHHQFLIDDKDNKGYKSPITISLLGVFNKPLGIKVTLYNTENLQENGLFLTVDEYLWVRDIVLEQYNKKKKKANKQEIKEQSEITKNYYIHQYLFEWGYEIIQKGFNCYKNEKGILEFTINRNTIENNYIEYQNQKPKQSIIRAEDFLQNEIFLNIILEDLNEKFQQSK